jgi:hypothetical protein
MNDLLCKFALQFPHLAARILYRDRHKRRNFREETITDVLMGGLTGFEPFGIKVDFPQDESKTGEDMDWEFVNPNAPDGRCYLRLHIQAKRAKLSTGKKSPYWFYQELDHATPKGAQSGSQHKILTDNATLTPGCVALYMFYHPYDAVVSSSFGLPAIEGVNVMFADLIPQKLTSGKWSFQDKKVDKWRPNFMPLSALLCFGHNPEFLDMLRDELIEQFLITPSGSVFPGELADRLNELRRNIEGESGKQFSAISVIPDSTKQAIENISSKSYAAELERPRVIFYSN